MWSLCGLLCSTFDLMDQEVNILISLLNIITLVQQENTDVFCLFISNSKLTHFLQLSLFVAIKTINTMDLLCPANLISAFDFVFVYI